MDKEKLDELKIQLQQLLNEAQEFVQQIPPAQLCTAVGVVLFTVFLFTVMYYLLKHRSANTILLTGLSGSGKTVLFYQGSVTSTKPNEGRFLLHSEANKKGKMKHVHVVDVPGHSRLLAKLDEFLSRAAGIVFVVDSVEFLPHLRIASEYLYDILTNASVVKRKTPLLLLCNKIDRVTAHSMDFIRRQLEKEMTVLSSADTSDEHTLGVVGEAFAFSQCHNKVTTAEASGLTGDIYHLEQFISECVKP
ncbi:signal recognition particle receptor subunit beta-like isoform X2 [Salvia divinorum]|uniref:Signal recognition particle receptor subunit beta n=1 Tax=Salvia divinorum TaxID=28513 RepID=A0ABD1H4D3_SALDI